MRADEAYTQCEACGAEGLCNNMADDHSGEMRDWWLCPACERLVLEEY